MHLLFLDKIGKIDQGGSRRSPSSSVGRSLRAEENVVGENLVPDKRADGMPVSEAVGVDEVI